MLVGKVDKGWPDVAGRQLHVLKVKPANYGGPLRMLDGAEVPEDDGTAATVERLERIAALFKLKDRARWHALARGVGLTEAQAAAIIRANLDGWHLSNDLAGNMPGMVPTV